jgi:hypothetical protein
MERQPVRVRDCWEPLRSGASGLTAMQQISANLQIQRVHRLPSGQDFCSELDLWQTARLGIDLWSLTARYTARAEVSLCYKAAKCQLAAEGDPFDTPVRLRPFASVPIATSYSRWHRDRAPPFRE